MAAMPAENVHHTLVSVSAEGRSIRRAENSSAFTSTVNQSVANTLVSTDTLVQ